MATRTLFILTVKLGGGRAVSLSTSRDFKSWTEPELIFEADDLDQELGEKTFNNVWPTQTYVNLGLIVERITKLMCIIVDVYNMGVFRYQGYYLGTPAMYHATSGVKNYPNTDGYHLVQLACSRDLKTWHRLGNRSPFIGPSPLSSGAYDLAQIIVDQVPHLVFVHFVGSVFLILNGVRSC